MAKVVKNLFGSQSFAKRRKVGSKSNRAGLIVCVAYKHCKKCCTCIYSDTTVLVPPKLALYTHINNLNIIIPLHLLHTQTDNLQTITSIRILLSGDIFRVSFSVSHLSAY